MELVFIASGRQGFVGIGKQADFLTGVAPTSFFNATEGIGEERGRLREELVFGTRAKVAADPGRLRLSGPISGLHARAGSLGHLLRAALGVPATTGAAGAFTHVFTPVVANFSQQAALPPYSVSVKRRGGMIHRYTGGQCGKMTIKQPKDNALTVDTDWMFRDVESVADSIVVLEQGTRFRFKHLAIKRAGAAFDFVEDLTITIDNALETEEVLDQSDVVSAIEFGANSTIGVQMTITFRDSSIYNDFKNNAVQPWNFLWTIDANRSLEIEMPRLNIESWSAPISGPGRMTVSVGGVAEYDVAAGLDLVATLKNTVAGY